MALWKSLPQNFRELVDRNHTKIRFILAGGINTLVGISIYPMLFFIAAPLKLHYITILIICQLLCVIIAFLTNKLMVFRTSGNYIREFVKFASFHLTYFAVNLVTLPILVELVCIKPVLAQTMLASFVIITSYFWHSQITFSSQKAPN
jgi:putative flippase GtrA